MECADYYAPLLLPTLIAKGFRMAGFIVTAELGSKDAFKLARSVASRMEYTVERLDESTFQATQGSLTASIFLGAFIAYCEFEIEIRTSRYNGEVDVVINRNCPWWTGWLGLKRVKNRASELASAIADEIERDGSRVLKEKEFS